MDLDDLPVGGEWAVGSLAGVAIKWLLWLSVIGAVLLLAALVFGWPRRRR